jgi:hypothetical protein
VDTAFPRHRVNLVIGEVFPKEFDRFAGEEMALKKRLVAGKIRHKTPIARLEHKPGLAGKSGTATPTGSGL